MKYVSALGFAVVGAVAVGLVGCGSDESATASDDDFPAPDVGAQLASSPYTLKAGEEKYVCWSFQVPADADLHLVGVDSNVPTSGVHHYGVFTDLTPDSADPAGWECAAMGVGWGLISGGGIGTPGAKFPAGTAMTLLAGTNLVLQLHLINTSSAPLDVDPVRINLDGTEAAVQDEVGLLVNVTTDIDIPAHAMGVKAESTCEVSSAMDHIFDAFPHMHQLGKQISLAVSPADGGAERSLSDVTWNFSDQGLYPVSGAAKAGDTLKLTCTWDNPGATDVKFGLSSADEMCVDVLYYYPATKQSTYCGL